MGTPSVVSCPGSPFQQKPGGAEGRVVDAGSGEPISKAVVILRTGPDGGVAAYTNATGLFHFENLDPGAYTATASRDGYVADRKAPPSVVTIQPEKTESDITLKLVRTGAVSDQGAPVPDTTLMLLPDHPHGNEGFGQQCRTDARGACTARGIEPGEYHAFAFAKDDRPDAHDTERMKAIGKYGKAVAVMPSQRMQLQLQPVPTDE